MEESFQWETHDSTSSKGGMLLKKSWRGNCPTLLHGGARPGGQGGLWDSWTHGACVVSAAADQQWAGAASTRTEDSRASGDVGIPGRRLHTTAPCALSGD